MPQLPPQKSNGKRAKLVRTACVVLAASAIGLSASPQNARAIVVSHPSPAASAPTPQPAGPTLPLDSSLFFVLDGTISSHAQAGTNVRAHLRDPLIVNGIVAAPAGAPVEIRVVHSQGAQLANVDGSVDIYFEPFTLANGKTLPLVTPVSHIDPHLSAGQASTRGITDTVGDIFIPYHYLYHILRKGMEVDLRPGTVMRARTAAELRARGGIVAVVMPPPIAGAADSAHPSFVTAPVVTPPGFVPPTPKPSPSSTPTATP